MPSVSLKIDLSAAKGIADAMPPDRLERVLIAAARKAMAPVVRAIKAAAPIGTTSVKKRHLAGMLQRSILFKVRTQHGPLRFQIASTPYGHLVESGHRLVKGGHLRRVNAPTLSRREGRRLGLFFGGRLAGATTGRVVGQVKPYPFVEPIVNASLDRIQQQIADEIIHALALAARIRKAVS